MDGTLFTLYMATIAYGLDLPNTEVEGYYVVDGTEHSAGPLHEILGWHRRVAETDPTSVSAWAMASVALAISAALEPN